MLVALGALIAGGACGAMAFFSFVAAPAAFRVLGDEVAGDYVRGVFPAYFLATALAAAIAALLFGAAGLEIAGAAAIVAAALLWGQRLVLLPRLDRLRAARAAGDEAARRTFAKLHGLSMVLNLVAMALCAVAVLSAV